MVISDIKKGFNGRKEMGGKPGKSFGSHSGQEKSDKSVFGGKPEIFGKDLKEKFRKASPFIPGAGGAMYNLSERMQLAEEITRKYGTFFEKNKFEDIRMFRDLERQKFQAKTEAEKIVIDRKIRFLKREIRG